MLTVSEREAGPLEQVLSFKSGLKRSEFMCLCRSESQIEASCV